MRYMVADYPTILWVADGPMVGSGYGIQTALTCHEFKKNGVPLGIIARGGIEEHVPFWEGIPCFPKLGHPWGYDVIPARMQDIGAEVCIALHDLVVANPQRILERGVRWAPWAPVDTEPISPVTFEKLRVAWDPMTYSQFGVAEAKAHGLDLSYIPHVLDPAFTPGDKAKAREEHFEGRIPNDAFLFTLVGANKSGNHNRKGIIPALQAFAQIAAERDDVHLYLHTIKDPIREGVLDLNPICRILGINPERITFAEVMRLGSGEIGSEDVANIYRASDCVLTPGTMEGFCLPIIEAHACGTPVVGGAWQAMRELYVEDYDYTVGIEESEAYWNDGLKSWLQLIHVDALVREMTNAMDNPRPKVKAGQVAAATRETYAPANVFEKYWKPKLNEWRERIDTELKDE